MHLHSGLLVSKSGLRAGRFVVLFIGAGIGLAASAVLRIALMVREGQGAASGLLETLSILLAGAVFDMALVSYIMLPFALWLGLLPESAARSRLHRMAVLLSLGLAAFLSLIGGVAEWLFWEEFGARFNFIAVDYLIYTREVLGNALESYPVGSIVAAAAILATGIAAVCARPAWKSFDRPTGVAVRVAIPLSLLALAAAFTVLLSANDRPQLGKDVATELSGNGIYQFFSAFRRSSLDYAAFYATLPLPEAHARLRADFEAGGDVWPADSESGIDRMVLNAGPERRLNVVLVSLESLGAGFMGAFGDPRGLTPHLDRLAGESLFFTNVFATGNRTVRGLEALSLAIPPTPGESIVKRPGATGLFSLGSIFEDRGYETLFLYGGYGYFDNMNAFFAANDYRVVDRTAISAESVHHETIWGVADEDLFDFSLGEFDRAYGSGKPFFAHIMTTSNHRPYTYPDGRIDIPSGSGREGAVKYSDFAIGRFMEAAAKRAWYRDTVFVITADHGANARGTSTIPVEQYRIPLLLHSPRHIPPGRIDRLMSQIDVPPTVLGRLGFSYRTKFFGCDIFRTPSGQERAFVANYQALGYLKAGHLVTLTPQRKVQISAFGPTQAGAPSDQVLRDEAIAWYQIAADAFGSDRYRDDEANRVPATAAMVRR